MSTVIDGAHYVLVSDGAASEILEEQGGAEIVEVLVPGAQGPPGIPGPIGPSGLTGFNFTQASASTTWTIAHNLGHQPVVDARNTGGALVWGEILHLSINVIQIVFTTAIAGTARCV